MTLNHVALAMSCWLLLAPAEGRAHWQTFPIAGDAITIRTDAGPGSQAFDFTSTDGSFIVVQHDPAADGAALLVRGEGDSGGRTPLVVLDPSRWSAVPGGFQYSDPSGSRGGVTSVEYTGGVISIQASSEGWGWSPAGAQDAVWVHLRVEDEWYCAQFTPANADVVANAAGHFEATGAPPPGACPEVVCGDGVRASGEACDDGNLVDGDGCDADCSVGSCSGASFESTFEGIQEVIFESTAYGCTRAACHDGVEPDGDLDLTRDAAYESLLGADGLGAPGSTTTFKRVLPTEPAESLLFLKLAAKKPGYTGPDVGSGMPTGLTALSDEHLEAVRRWIRGGAPRDRVVEGTAALLGTCFPDPDPLKTPPPAPPDAAGGFQLQQTPYPLPNVDVNRGESELCMATWYDLSDRVPESARVPCNEIYAPSRGCVGATFEFAPAPCETDAQCSDGKTCQLIKNRTNPDAECVAYDRLTVIQDPQSHHSILGVYTGRSDASDPGWGEWSYRFEPDDPNATLNGQPCDPTDVDPALGYHPGCSSEPVDSVACVNYGPRDLGNLSLIQGGAGSNLPQISLSQETYYDFVYPDDVYNVIPVKGIMVWNSHAFNLTQQDSTMQQFLNIEYAPPPDRVYPSIELFDASWIFAQFVPPFETREVCATSTLPQFAKLFQLSSHTHLRGVRWRTWAPPNAPCRPQCPTVEDDPFMALYYQNGGFGNVVRGLCDNRSELPLCDGPRADAPIYLSTDYADPLNLVFDPPLALDSPDEEDRTFLFCSTFDNGATPTSPPVKRYSTSPQPPDLGFGVLGQGILGGPCYPGNIACLDGPKQGEICGNPNTGPDDAFCDSFPGAGDGVCDACPVHGGVTTEDEMFILLGNYFVPEPASTALGGAALAALAALARRRAAA